MSRLPVAARPSAPAQAVCRTPSLATPLALLTAVLLAACGGSEAPQAAASRASGSAGDGAEGRKTALAATTRLAVPLSQPADALMQGLNIPSDAATRGMWGPVQSWPMNAMHAALLPDGRVLTYGASQNTDNQDGRTFSTWTPSLGFGTGSHQISFEAGRVNSFCSTATYLSDARLLITGGNSPRNSNLFTAAGNQVATDAFSLADERWYATMITLGDGRAVMLGGMNPYSEGMLYNPDAAIQNGQVSMTPELYTPGVGWRTLSGASSRDAFGPDHLRTSFPRAWVAPNGEVFGISADRMWSLNVDGNNGLGSLRVLGTFKGVPSATSPLNVGATNNAVMYAPGRILQLGGNGGFNGDGLPASNMATVVDINGATPTLTETARMNHARRFANSTVLPNGHVLVTGGTRRGNNGGADAVFPAESWNPATGTWTPLASAAVVRVYHSTALLLPNGTVLSMGGGTPGPVFNLNAEVYYPPYLFRAQGTGSVLATRPVATGINARSHVLGGRLQLEMLNTNPVSRLVLVRNSTVTHSFNNSQRFHELTFTQNGDLLEATLPRSPFLLPPGPYQLFALDAAGVPSVGVGITLTPPPVATVPRDQPLLWGSARAEGSVMAVNATGLGVLSALGSAPTEPQLASARLVARAGLADAACVSLELASQPGRWLRHAGFRLQLATNDGSALFRQDATFCPEPGLAGHSVTLRSRNFPTRVIRERGGELWLDEVAGADPVFRQSATWVTRTATTGAPLPTFGPFAAAPVTLSSGTASVSFAPGEQAAGLSFSWNFGDGSAPTAWSASSAGQHTYRQPGVYSITLTVRNTSGQTASTTFAQAVTTPAVAGAPRASTGLWWEPRAGGPRLWVVNPDSNTVAVLSPQTGERLAEVTVGQSPRTLAVAPSGQVWVVNRGSASLSIIDPGSLAVVRTVALPPGSEPYGLVFAPNGSHAYVALEGHSQVVRLQVTDGTPTGVMGVGDSPRHLAITADSSRLLVSRFITAPLPGESTRTVSTGGAVGGEVWAVNTSSFMMAGTAVLRHSDKTDNEVQGSGIPNYLGAAAISPDGRSAWVPSKQDNIRRGAWRSGQALDFQNTVRAISSRLDLTGARPVENLSLRVDHDNASVASAAVHHPSGAYLFVTLETSRQVAVVDAARGRELFRAEVGLAPQSVTVSPDGSRLVVQNFMSRTVSVLNLQPLVRQGRFVLPEIGAWSTTQVDLLGPEVQRGKQLFYDASDRRLSRDSYMSCATCHNDGGQDGRVWDLTGFGEGLRNTASLRGRAGMGHGALHWSGNFDEVQDFEHQIRLLAGGLGLIENGTPHPVQGTPNAGRSTDLDALAAYVGSLSQPEASSTRPTGTALSLPAQAGAALFAQSCATCHGGATSTDSAFRPERLHNIGTLKEGSGKRLGATLTGLDSPTLWGVGQTAPYLHDGSAATLEAAISAHGGTGLNSTQVSQLAEFLREATPADYGAEQSGLLAEYFANATLTGTPAVRRHEAVDFDWGIGGPAGVGTADNFSARWSGTVQAPVAGNYTFHTWSDDGIRLWINGQLVIDNWTVHAPTLNSSAVVPLAAGQVVSVRLEYFEAGGGAVARLLWQPPGASSPVAIPRGRMRGPQPGLAAEYFANTTLSGVPALRRWEAVDHRWGGGAPAEGLPADRFSARFTGSFSAPVTGAYQLQTVGDDGIRLWVDGQLVVNSWFDRGDTADTTGVLNLVAGQRVSLRMEYYENGGGATARLLWRTPGSGAFVPIPVQHLYTTAPQVAAPQGLRGEYFAGTALAGSPLATRLEAVDFGWGLGSAGAGLPADQFSARWTGSFTAPAAGTYQVQTIGDDGLRLWLNGQLVVNSWWDRADTADTTGAFTLAAGQRVDVRMEYYENGGYATARLLWRPPGAAGFTPIPLSALSPQRAP